MFYEYRQFLSIQLRDGGNQEILLIILAFFVFFILFSIFYNIYIFYNNKFSYKRELLKFEKEYISLKNNLNSGLLDVNTYKKRVNLLNIKVSEKIK
tara:strand:- start:96 stop:383 length:288 start_codon:yes stop_codon:yes gene_type:complete